MKGEYSKIGLEVFCRLFGVSRQAWYQYQKRQYGVRIEEDLILEVVGSVRKRMKRLGGRKLLGIVHERLPSIVIGRDAFFDLLRTHGLLVRKRKRSVKTTHTLAWMFKYPNLIKGLAIDRPNMVWVSDITYIETKEGFMYLFLITDAYSHKIVGYCLADNLKAENGVKALRMAIENSIYPVIGLIHHSDRGTQYCSQEYVSVLEFHQMGVSMTENGEVLENALAERVNGILKDEFIYDLNYTTKQQAIESIDEIIQIYNAERPHSSIDDLKPEQAHQLTGPIKKKWKNYYKKPKQNLGFDRHETECMFTETEKVEAITNSDLMLSDQDIPSLDAPQKSQSPLHLMVQNYVNSNKD